MFEYRSCNYLVSVKEIGDVLNRMAEDDWEPIHIEKTYGRYDVIYRRLRKDYIPPHDHSIRFTPNQGLYPHGLDFNHQSGTGAKPSPPCFTTNEIEFIRKEVEPVKGDNESFAEHYGLESEINYYDQRRWTRYDKDLKPYDPTIVQDGFFVNKNEHKEAEAEWIYFPWPRDVKNNYEVIPEFWDKVGKKPVLSEDPNEVGKAYKLYWDEVNKGVSAKEAFEAGKHLGEVIKKGIPRINEALGDHIDKEQ